MASILPTSYLVQADFLKVGGVEFFDTPELRPILPDSSDIFFEVTAAFQNRPDLIAFDFYDDEQLWWVLALANSIDIVPSGFYTGRRIRVPSLDRVTAYVSQGNR
jgi:hypothetical protein